MPDELERLGVMLLELGERATLMLFYENEGNALWTTAQPVNVLIDTGIRIPMNGLEHALQDIPMPLVSV